MRRCEFWRLSSLLVAVAALSIHATDGQRPFVFTECRPLSVRIGDLPESLKPSKDDFKAVVEKRLSDAGLLAQTPNDLILRLRITDLGRRAYLVDLDLFHRMDDHEYGSGLVILWSTLGFEQYRNGSVPIRGLARLAEGLAASFVADYTADACRR